MSRPPTWPRKTNRMPKWNSGLPHAQQPALVELGRAGGPAELVVAVAPVVADHEDRDGDVGHRDEQDRVGGAHRTPPAGSGMYSGGANGARPTCSSGGPAAARRATASCSSPRNAGSVAQTDSSTCCHGEADLGQREAQQLDRRPGARAAGARPLSISPCAMNSSTTARWSGSSSSPSVEAGSAVGLLQLEQRDTTVAGVAVLVVGQVEAAALARGRRWRRSRRRARTARSLGVVDEPPQGVRPLPARWRKRVGARAGRPRGSSRPGSRASSTGAASRSARRVVVTAAPRGWGNSPSGLPLPSQFNRLTRRARSATGVTRVAGLPLAQHLEVLDRDRAAARPTTRRTGRSRPCRGRRRSSGCTRWPAPPASGPARRAPRG